MYSHVYAACTVYTYNIDIFFFTRGSICFCWKYVFFIIRIHVLVSCDILRNNGVIHKYNGKMKDCSFQGQKCFFQSFSSFSLEFFGTVYFFQNFLKIYTSKNAEISNNNFFAHEIFDNVILGLGDSLMT